MRDREVYIPLGDIDMRGQEALTLPKGVIKCVKCGGNGKHIQRYIEGSFTGDCTLCGGEGFVHEDTGDPVSPSVVNQIAEANRMTVVRLLGFGHQWRFKAEEVQDNVNGGKDYALIFKKGAQ